MRLSLHSNFCVCIHSKRETYLKTDSRVFSEEISLKQDNLWSKFVTILQKFLHPHWPIFIVNKRTDMWPYDLWDATMHKSEQLTICYCKKQIYVSFPCVCFVIDKEFRHSIVKVICNVMTKLMINDTTDAWKSDVKLLNLPRFPSHSTGGHYHGILKYTWLFIQQGTLTLPLN